VILFIYKKTLKKEDIHCTCITPGQDLVFALGCLSFRGFTPSLMLEYDISYKVLNFSQVILNPGQNSIGFFIENQKDGKWEYLELCGNKSHLIVCS